MAALPSSFPESSSSSNHVPSRKHQSLGLLSSNFLSLYDGEDVQLIDLDEAASRLGAERRRIDDIANILEGVGVLERKAKNQYWWKGLEAIPAALQQLKEEGLKENLGEFNGNDCANVSGVDRHGSGKKCPQGSKQFNFGPFAPAFFAEVGPVAAKRKKTMIGKALPLLIDLSIRTKL